MKDIRAIHRHADPMKHAEDLIQEHNAAAHAAADERAAAEPARIRARDAAWRAEAARSSRAEAKAIIAHADRVTPAALRGIARRAAAMSPQARDKAHAANMAHARNMLAMGERAGEVPANAAERAMATYAHASRFGGLELATVVAALPSLRALAAHKNDPTIMPLRFDLANARNGQHTGDGWEAFAPEHVHIEAAPRRARGAA